MNKDKKQQNETDSLKQENLRLKKELNEIRQSKKSFLPLEKTKQIMSFLENSTSSIMLKDTEGKYLLINQHVANLLEIPRENLIGKKDRDLFTPDLAEQFEEEDRIIMSTEKPMRSEHAYKSHGKTRFFMTTRFPLFDISGSINAIGMVSTEITELKEAQNELDRHREHLEKIVHERTSELEKTNSELTEKVKELTDAKEEIKKLNKTLKSRITERTLELHKTSEALEQSHETIRETREKLILSEKMASVGTLLTEATHEINTPVGIGITTATHIESKTRGIQELLIKKTLSASEITEYIDNVLEASAILKNNLDRAADLIKGLKNIGVDQCSRNIRKINLNEYIHEIITTLAPKLKRTRHQIKINCSPGIEVMTSPGAIAQIITNLVINSLKHGFEKSHNGTIIIDVKNKVDTILLVYTDDGVGVKAEYVQKIFDPYFTTKRNEGSSGLGMHIVHNLVTEEMKGTITLNSEKNRGVEFIIEFPSFLQPLNNK